MKPCIVILAIVAIVAGCNNGPSQRVLDIQESIEEQQATSRPVARSTPRPATDTRCAGVTIWGCNAHREVAVSRDCADLQSWFDAADEQRIVLLDRFGPSDPDYRYALDVMRQAHDRMGAIGCYG